MLFFLHMPKDKSDLRQAENADVPVEASEDKSVTARLTGFFKRVLRKKVADVVDPQSAQAVSAETQESPVLSTIEAGNAKQRSTPNLLVDALRVAVESFRGDERIVANAILEQVEKNGGPSVLGFESYQRDEDVIRRGEKLPGQKDKDPQGEGCLRILMDEGSVGIFLPGKDGNEMLIETVRGYSLLGEMSALGLAKMPTATVRAGEQGAVVLTFPAKLLRDIYDDPTSEAHRVLDLIIKKRLHIQRKFAPSTVENTQVVINLATQFAGRADRSIAQRIGELIPKEGISECKYREYGAGEYLYTQDEPTDSVAILIDGTCSFIKHGVRIASDISAGTNLGDVAFSQRDQMMPYSIRADSPCRVLSVSKRLFSAVQASNSMDIALKAATKFVPLSGESSSHLISMASQLDLEAMLAGASKRQHYRATKATLRMSALERVGNSEEMLYFLSTIGLLTLNGRTVEIVREDGRSYKIRCNGIEEDVTKDELKNDNLAAVLDTKEEVQKQIGLFAASEFTADDATFLLENGYGLPEVCDAECQQRLEELRQRLPTIQKASFALDENFEDQPELRDALKQLLFDFDYPLSVITLLADDNTRPTTIAAIRTITQESSVSDIEFRAKVEGTLGRMDPAFVEASRTFDEKHVVHSVDRNFAAMENRKTASDLFRSAILQKDHRLSLARSVGNEPTPKQREALEKEIITRTDRIAPRLQGDLSSIASAVAGPSVSGGFPSVTCRTKNVEGVLDKIARMRSGNAGKEPRPDYIVADMPDITGGRIIARDIDQLKEVVDEFEKQFAGKILQKDNFYTSEKKRQNPYRVITYTVLIGQYPCEVQISTLHASIAADVMHNIEYKKIASTSFSGQKELKEFSKKAALFDLQRLTGHNLASALEQLRPFELDASVLTDFRESLDYDSTRDEFVAAVQERVHARTLTPEESATILNLLQTAEYCHEKQTYAIQSVDKKTGKLKYPTSALLAHVPYINHSVRVGTFALQAGLSADAVIAAIFHDALEDQPQAWAEWAAEKCPSGARTLVEDLSEIPAEPREAYMARMEVLTGEAKLIKALDRLDNLLRGHTMLSAKYLRRTLNECDNVYDEAFKQYPELSKFSALYAKYRASIEHLLECLS